MGSPVERAGGSASSELLQATTPRTSPASAASFATAPSTSMTSSRSNTPLVLARTTACILFSVSVPVLSVQMTVVDPSVSMAERRFTSPPERARSLTPIASASVIVGRSPSGTFATIRPMAKLAASETDRPASSPRGRNARPATTATSAISHATRRTWRSSGLSSRSTRSESAAIRPSSVFMPVANTRARASPSVAAVPLKTRSRASSSGPRSTRSADR